MRRIVALQYLSFAARGLILPFIGLYLISQGFTKTELGLLISASALVQLFVTPALHTFADRKGRHRQLYYLLVAGSMVATLGFTLPAGKLWFAFVFLLREACDMPNAALLSQLTITWLEQRSRAIYGRLRAFGSLGWSMTAPFAGAISRAFGYPPLFLASGALTLALLPFAKELPARTSERTEAHPRVPRTRSFKILLTALFPYYMGLSALNGFVFVYFARELGASNDFIGFTSAVAAISEILPMFGIDFLLRRINPFFALVAGMTGMVFLMLSYTVIHDPLLLIPLMMLRGSIFALTAIGLPLLIPRVSHPANVATNQALAQVTLLSVATALTGFVSGAIFDLLGGRMLFRAAAALAMLGIGILLILRRYIVDQPAAAPLSIILRYKKGMRRGIP
jgi:MFS transporter, PPP family, 3-phenylpropionic acid transporter